MVDIAKLELRLAYLERSVTRARRWAAVAIGCALLVGGGAVALALRSPDELAIGAVHIGNGRIDIRNARDRDLTELRADGVHVSHGDNYAGLGGGDLTMTTRAGQHVNFWVDGTNTMFALSSSHHDELFSIQLGPDHVEQFSRPPVRITTP
jgi:hypothetical protein